MEIAIDEIYDDLTYTEMYFNWAGAIPFLGIFSGYVRCLAGAVQTLVGVVFAAFGHVEQKTCSRAKLREWQDITSLGHQNVQHGLLNILRGQIECQVGMYNALCSPILAALQFLWAVHSESPHVFAPIVPYKGRVLAF